ncbi:helix-turn-helix domain-containing protein [Rhizobium sp. CECT 9324]|uniref:helix-turn-helix domain-containing protein n=1 Tax=Rhizobium sp. CECT 9324 TaxID=2845820 RepID=UPI001E524CB1|nr:helix-turn-helix domain-containing protein [Rhizobium sp. CECT 9324]CAH0339198.1 Nitrogen fixation regulation protein FixK [Rhizobium sp. CECT 9324]
MHASFNAATIALSAPKFGSQFPAAVTGFAKPQLIINFAADEEIYGPGDKAGTFYKVAYGAVRICRLLTDGRRQIIAFHLAGETFGFEPGLTHGFFAEAITETGLRAFNQYESAETSHELLSLVLNEMVRAQEHLLVVGRQTALERIISFLLDISSRQGDLEHTELPMSRIDIADYLGMTIETVSRAFAKLRQDGYINLPNARTVEIRRGHALRDLCE